MPAYCMTLQRWSWGPGMARRLRRIAQAARSNAGGYGWVRKVKMGPNFAKHGGATNDLPDLHGSLLLSLPDLFKEFG